MIGNLVLYKNKSNAISYVNSTKNEIIIAARKEALELAKNNNKSAYAVSDISFQVIRTESGVELYSDYYLWAW
jgi:hypothetical protein